MLQDGEQYHERGSYRTMSIGKALISNGDFRETDPKTGKVKGWNLKKAGVVKKDGKAVLSIQPGGQASQLIWDWKGPLGQSPKPRSIQIHFRASGKGKLNMSATNYTDDWSGGKLKRKFHGSERIGQVELTPETRNYTFRYTIKADRWMGLYITALKGAEIESVAVTLE